MASRLSLHSELIEVLGSNFVYFQPPETVKLSYPCITYSLSQIDIKHADDGTYRDTNAYDLIVIYKDPDSDIVKRLIHHFRMIRFDRAYVSDNLYHAALRLFY